MGDVIQLPIRRPKNRTDPYGTPFGMSLSRNLWTKDQIEYTVSCCVPSPDALRVLFAVDDPASFSVTESWTDSKIEGFVYFLITSTRTIESHIFEAYPETNTIFLTVYLDMHFGEHEHTAEEQEEVIVAYEWTAGGFT